MDELKGGNHVSETRQGGRNRSGRQGLQTAVLRIEDNPGGPALQLRSAADRGGSHHPGRRLDVESRVKSRAPGARDRVQPIARSGALVRRVISRPCDACRLDDLQVGANASRQVRQSKKAHTAKQSARWQPPTVGGARGRSQPLLARQYGVLELLGDASLHDSL